jgi:PAS domain S-box-containing protein
LRHLGDSLPGSAIYQYAHEPDGTPRYHYLSAGIEQLNGVRIEDALRDAGVLNRQILPEYLPKLAEAEQRSARDLSDFKMEVPMQLPSGEVRWMGLQSRPQRLPDGRVMWDGVRIDITERKTIEEALRESEERFHGVFKHAAIGIAITDLKARFLSCNPAHSALLGYTEEELRAINFLDLVHPEDRDANSKEIRRLLAGEIPSFEIVNRYLAKGGKPVWVHKHVSLLRNAAGEPTSLVVLVTDITERKRHEEHTQLLMREIDHRAKNLLAVVLSIARQTAATKPDDFIARFGDRIQALSASQDLLVQNAWNGVDITALVHSQLAHFQDLIGTRIALKGPPVFLSASAAQTIGMALHELSTNAGKYGALSNGDGRLEVEWSFERAEGDEQAFVMSWREEGGPPVMAPARRGFGLTVIERVARETLDAQVDLDFVVTGLSWRLRCPAKQVCTDAAPSLPDDRPV